MFSYISHRGNLIGSFPEKENSPPYIQHALEKGFEVEIDVRFINGKIFLGHDNPDYQVDIYFLEDSRLWCHAKNLEALELMKNNPKIHCFWHQNDDVCLTSKKYIWTFPGKKLLESSISVMPEIIKKGNEPFEIKEKCAGICSDFIYYYKYNTF